MKSRNGFTLIELLIVILIVGILAAVVLPMMRGRIDAGRWAEGKAIAGTIARALRLHIGEQGEGFTAVPTLEQLGFRPTDLQGTYFAGGESGIGDFAWVINDNDPVNFLVTIAAPPSIATPSHITLDHTGTFREIP